MDVNSGIRHVHVALDVFGFWNEWNATPGIVIPLAIGAALYARACVAMRESVRARRMERVDFARQKSRTSQRNALLFVFGWTVLALSLLSPLHALSEQFFSAHMVQHELLMTVAVPLIVLSNPAPTFLWAVPVRWRRAAAPVLSNKHSRQVRRFFGHPVAGWMAYAITLWAWHAPALFQMTLRDEQMHALQHTCFIVASVWFWHTLFQSRSRSQGQCLLLLFTTAVHTSVLGALITFDSTIWYPAYAATTEHLGGSALHDQQLAGMIMWVPGSVPYLLAALATTLRILRRAGQHRWTLPIPSE